MATNTDEILTWSFIRKCEPSKEIIEILVDNEEIYQCYATVRDIAALTNKRVIVVDVQGIGKKKEIYSLPYRSIDMWSSENTGTFDLNQELDLWTKAGQFKLKIASKCDIREFDKILGNGILNSK
ncbi:PH domain-containing protein [Erysipelotrichaceae bacterium HCN-30851]